MKAGFAASVLAAAVATLAVQVAEAQQVGTAAAVNPAAQARGASGARTIVIGQSIAHRERIQTTSAGSVQLLFLDKTSMTIGPNSDLAIDEYVYDPVSNSGKLAATLTKGVMRFVGGQISHAGNAQVTTPTAVVGIRGGVGIFQPNSVYIGYGEGSVQSGASNLLLTAGDYIQTFGGNTPPTNPGPPPANFLQSVLATLQSQAGQGGGARASAGQVNQARTAATGTATGNIANNAQAVVNQSLTNATQTNATISNINQTVQTTASQSAVAQESFQPTFLTGFTGGISREENGNHSSEIVLGAALFQSSANREQATFFLGNGGMAQFGSVDPNLPPSSTTISGFDDVIGTVKALLPAVDANGKPISTSEGGVPVAEQKGLLVQFKPGTQLTNSAQQVLGGTPFCDCEFTRWGFWTADVRHANSNLRESIDAFWVAGKLPEVGQVPTTGTATYTGHAVAQIQNGSQEYSRSAPFQNIVNFGTKSGTFTISNLDNATYTGTTAINSHDPRAFVGFGQSQQERAIVLFGNFFNGKSGPVGEMGGGLVIGNNNLSYKGSGIFIAKTP